MGNEQLTTCSSLHFESISIPNICAWRPKKLAKRVGIHPQQHLFQELTMERHILGFDTLKNTWPKFRNSETLIHR